jgi:SNF2 family DNA or RNA helicase
VNARIHTTRGYYFQPKEPNSVVYKAKENIMEHLKKYQVDGVKWMVDRENGEGEFHGEEMPLGGVLADEVGLGKTLQTICLILENPGKTLILAPKSLVSQWIDECKRFAPKHRIKHIKDTDNLTDGVNTYIVSVSVLNKGSSDIGNTPLHNIKWDRIVVDEAHSIKNKKSKLHQSISQLQSTSRWCLTATPVMNRMTDFISLMQFIGVPQLTCQCYKADVVERFILRRTKDDVKKSEPSMELPPLNIEVCRIPFSSQEERLMYVSVYNDTRKELRKQSNENAIEILERLLRVRQICAYPQCYIDGMKKKNKTQLDDWEHDSTKVTHIVNDILQVKHQKSLLFCQFIKEMGGYEKSLREFGMKVTRIDGSMTMDERTASIKMFKETDVNVLIIQIHTGGQGYNLQMAQNVFITCPTWNPCIEYQAIGRAHRTGQTETVTVKKYIISDENDTEVPYIEDLILDMHDKKRKIIADVLNDPRLLESGFSTSRRTGTLTYKDLKRMFRKKAIV